MNIVTAIWNGIGQLMNTKRYIFMAYGINFLLALVLAAGLSSILSDSMGNSAAGENLRNGFDPLWYRSFSAQAGGIAATFHPGVVGIGAVFEGLETMLSGNFLDHHWGIIALGLVYLLTWTFLSGGFISLYAARDQHPSFFQRGADLFPRYLVLTAMAGVVYFLIFHFVLHWLSDAVKALTSQSIDERIDFLYTVVKYILIWMLVWTVNLILDYSKIFVATTGHKNALSAPFKAARVVFSNFYKTYGLYFLIGLIWVGLLLFYWLISPGAGQSSWFTISIAFVVGQSYLLMRIGIRGLFYSGQTVLFKTITEE